ncbi:MAG: hypothetical protein ACJ76H_00840, partial [Bacteriovoracaceae bacterium]
YTKKNKSPSKRKTSQAKVIEIVHYALKVISSHQGVNPIKELRELTLDRHMHLREFLKRFEDNDPELLKITIKSCVDRKLSEREAVPALERFEEKYTYLNDETLEKATYEDPQLLKGIVFDERINPLARAHTLYALSFGGREEYFSFIASFVSHPSPFVRESALMGLFEYYDKDERKHLELKEFFIKHLKEEKAIGIKEKLSSLLERM